MNPLAQIAFLCLQAYVGVLYAALHVVWMYGAVVGRFKFKPPEGVKPATILSDFRYSKYRFWITFWEVVEARGVPREALPLLPGPLTTRLRRVAGADEGLPKHDEHISFCAHIDWAHGIDHASHYLYRVEVTDPREPFYQGQSKWRLCCSECLAEAGGHPERVYYAATSQALGDWT